MKKLFLKSTLLLFSAAALILSFPSCDDSEKVVREGTIQEDKIVINSGCLPLPEAEYNKIPLAETISRTKAYSSSVSLYCPPVGRQGIEGSCVAWSVGYAARSISWQASYGGSYGFDHNIFSPEFIYNPIKIGDCTSSAFARDALDLIKNQGVCVWNDMPYTDGPCDLFPNNKQVALAARYKISSYSRLPIKEDVFKNQLAAGKPIIVCGPIYTQFYWLGHDEIQTRADFLTSNSSSHCYCVVGYDDSKKAFQVYNSWGTGWGTNGYGWVSYDIMARVWKEAYVIYE